MRVPYGAQPALAEPDEELVAFTRASDLASRRLGISNDQFMARMLGHADAATICAAHNALTAALIDAGTPTVVARIFRRHASQVGER
jgi:hypothetical protein